MPRAVEWEQRIASHEPMEVKVEMEACYKWMEMSRTEALNYTSHLYRLQRLAAQSLPDLDKELADK